MIKKSLEIVLSRKTQITHWSKLLRNQLNSTSLKAMLKTLLQKADLKLPF